MQKGLILVAAVPIIAIICLTFFASSIKALDYSTGSYTNICGSGTAATTDSCNQGCNIASGSCSSSNNTVVKYTCDGKQSECRNNESSFSNSQSVSGTSCGKTVQIDVFAKTCRVNNQWVCGNQDLKDYVVWYSGDCKTQSTATKKESTKTNTDKKASDVKNTVINYFFPASSSQPASAPAPTVTLSTATRPSHTSSCDAIEVVSGNNSTVPATVTLRARGTDNSGNIQSYRFYFGDGQQTDSTNAEIQHTYNVSGTFTARADVKDSQGNWVTSAACQTLVAVQASPIESHKSDCSDIVMNASNNAQAPSTVTFTVNGYDNKGSLQGYRLDFGNGIVKDNNGQSFEQNYPKAGTYTVRAYVKDSQGNWVGGNNSCQRSLYISGKPLTHQPETGTETWISVIGLGSGAAAVALQAIKRRV